MKKKIILTAAAILACAQLNASENVDLLIVQEQLHVLDQEIKITEDFVNDTDKEIKREQSRLQQIFVNGEYIYPRYKQLRASIDENTYNTYLKPGQDAIDALNAIQQEHKRELTKLKKKRTQLLQEKAQASPKLSPPINPGSPTSQEIKSEEEQGYEEFLKSFSS